MWKSIRAAARAETHRKMDQGETLMRRVFVFALICMLVFPASATQQTWTNLGDDDNIVYTDVTEMDSYWVRTAGGNNYAYAYVTNPGWPGAGIMLTHPYQTTYSAVTHISNTGDYFGYFTCKLYDANMNQLQATDISNLNGGGGTGRFELKMDAGVPRYYRDGGLVKSGAALSQNPSFVFWGVRTIGSSATVGARLDDYVIAEPGAMQLSLSESNNNTIILLKDIVNTAQSGVAFGENATIINSNYLTSGRWSRGNASLDAGAVQPNETIQLKHLETGTVYATNYTGTGYTGTMAWNVKELLFDSGAPQGYYYLYRPKTGDTSNMMLYMSNGADVQWNSPTYSSGDSATVIYYVLDGGYWDTSTYSYRLDIYDVYGNVKATNALTASSGTISHAWSSSDEPGIYYAMLIAKDGSGNDYYLGSDQAELVSYFRVYGTVHNGPDTIPISGAMVNISQSIASQSIISGSIGNYTTEAVFVSGGTMNVTATADGHRPYTYSFVPLISKTISLNITLLPTTPVPGLAIDGVARDPTYGRPLEGVQVLVRNITNSQSYDRVTNMAGWYQCSLGEACNLVYGRPYDVNGTKLGYSNSPIYNVTASGVLT